MITVNQFAEPGDNWAGVGVFALERDQLTNCGAARMIYKDMLPGRAEPLGRHAPGRPRRLDDAACERACAADRGRRAGMGSGALPAGSTRRLERDRGLVGIRHDQRLARRAAPDGALRRESLQLRRVHPATRHVDQARHAQRPPHVPDGVPQLRRPPGDRRQPLGRRRRCRPCRRPVVRAPQDLGQLVDLPAGHLRAGHDGEPVDGLFRDGPRREHGHRLLDEQRFRAELSEHPLRRAPRHRSAEPALSG